MSRSGVRQATRGPQLLVDLAEEYLEHVGATRSLHTHATRRTAVAVLFVPWATAQGVTDLDEVDQALLDRYLRRLQTEPGPKGAALAPESVRTYAREVNVFLRWASAGVRVDPPPERQRVIELLTEEELDALESAATTPRDRLVVRLLRHTGIRVGELLNVKPQDAVRDRGRCFLVVHGKTGARILGLEPALYRELHAYASGGRALPAGAAADPEKHALVVSSRGGRDAGRPLTPSGVRQLVQELAHRAGIRKRVYPHLLRHTYATGFQREHKDPVTLRRILGHSSLAMIDKVYVHLAADDVHDAMVQHLQGRKRKGQPSSRA